MFFETDIQKNETYTEEKRKIKIRLAREEDYSQVECLMQQVHRLHLGWRPDIYKACDVVMPREVFEEALLKEELLVAETEEQIVGMARYKVRHMEAPMVVERNVLYVDSIAVDENYRRQGIGRCLLEGLKEIRKRKQLDGIELQVNGRNQEAKAMYEQCGFTVKAIGMELLEEGEEK